MDCFKLDYASDLHDPENVRWWTQLYVTLDMSKYPDKAG